MFVYVYMCVSVCFENTLTIIYDVVQFVPDETVKSIHRIMCTVQSKSGRQKHPWQTNRNAGEKK